MDGQGRDNLQNPNFLIEQAYGGAPVPGAKEKDDIGEAIKERPYYSGIGERGDYKDQLETFLKNMPWLGRIPGVASSVKTAGPPGEPIVEDPIDPDKLPAPNRERPSVNLGRVPLPPGDSTGGPYTPPGALLGDSGPSVLRSQAKVGSWIGLLPRYIRP